MIMSPIAGQGCKVSGRALGPRLQHGCSPSSGPFVGTQLWGCEGHRILEEQSPQLASSLLSPNVRWSQRSRDGLSFSHSFQTRQLGQDKPARLETMQDPPNRAMQRYSAT